ncbi:MAG: hypothetical protein IPG48_00015 [Saprospiraceae bacterium]|nr:hypothetical protein [Saprospiraceae bacterium]
MKILCLFPDVVKDAGVQYDPSTIANYAYNLAKAFQDFTTMSASLMPRLKQLLHSDANGDQVGKVLFRLLTY